MDEARLALFLAEYDRQVAEIEGIFSLLEEKQGVLAKEAVKPEMVESAGYWLHNLYCACEDLFKIVASFWENRVNVDGTFHIELLRRMILNIERVRPALLSENSYRFLDELRGFRHVFRHAYSYGLDDERVAFLLRRVSLHRSGLNEDLGRFRHQIASAFESEV